MTGLLIWLSWLLGALVVGLTGACRIGMDTRTVSSKELADACGKVRAALYAVPGNSSWSVNYHTEQLGWNKIAPSAATPYVLFVRGCWVALSAVLWPVAVPVLIAFKRGGSRGEHLRLLQAQLAEQNAVIEKIRRDEGWTE